MSEHEQNPYQRQYMNTPYTGGYQGNSQTHYPQTSPAYYPPYQYSQMPTQQQGATQGGYQMPPQQQGATTGGNQTQMPAQQQGSFPGSNGMLPMEQSYVENILRLNKGKIATLYMTFENNDQWNAKVFKGIIEAAGRDHIIISDSESGKRYLLLMVYLDYITFDEEIEYQYPYGPGNQVYMNQPM